MTQISVTTVEELEAVIGAGSPNVFVNPGTYDLSTLTATLTINTTLRIAATPGTVTFDGCTEVAVFTLASTCTRFECQGFEFTNNQRIVNVDNPEGSDLTIIFSDNTGSQNNSIVNTTSTTGSTTMRLVSGVIIRNSFDCNRSRFLNLQGCGFKGFDVAKNELANARSATIWIGQNDDFKERRRGIWVTENECYDVDDEYVAGNGNEEAHHVFVRSAMDVFIINNKLDLVHTQEVADNRVDNEAIYTKCTRVLIDGNIISNGGYTSIVCKGNKEESTTNLTSGDRVVVTNNIVSYEEGYKGDYGTKADGCFLNIGGSVVMKGNSFYNVRSGLDLKQQSTASQEAGSITVSDNYIDKASLRGLYVRAAGGFSNLTIARNKIVNQTSGVGIRLRVKVDSNIDIQDWVIVDNEIHGDPDDPGVSGIEFNFENQATTPKTFKNLFAARNTISHMSNGIKKSGSEPINGETNAIITAINVGYIPSPIPDPIPEGAYANQNYFYNCGDDYLGW